MNGLAPEYVVARRVLLDALGALERHVDSLILVGAQAVYHHTGDGDLNVPLMTTDADLAINAANLADVCPRSAGRCVPQDSYPAPTPDTGRH
jgi:hypothetical protein